MSPALEFVLRIWLAVFYACCAAVMLLIVLAAWLLLGQRSLRPRRLGRLSDSDRAEFRRRMLRDYEASEAIGDAADEAMGSHPRYRGIAPAAPEGLGPRILRRQPSNVIPPRAYFDRSARRAIDEVLAQMGEPR